MEAETCFASRLRALIKKSVKTQKELSAEMGISPQALSDYANGKREPGLYAASTLAHYFSVSIDYLVGDNRCTTPDNEGIHKMLGLSDKAIDALRSEKETSEIESGIMVGGINLLLETEKGRDILREICGYLLLDFNVAYPNIRGRVDINTPLTELAYRPIPGAKAYGVDLGLYADIQTEALERGLLVGIINLLQTLREVQHVDQEDSE